MIRTLCQHIVNYGVILVSSVNGIRLPLMRFKSVFFRFSLFLFSFRSFYFSALFVFYFALEILFSHGTKNGPAFVVAVVVVVVAVAARVCIVLMQL